MSTTALTVFESEYAVEVRDTHAHLRNSVPTVGTVAEGYGVWAVERNGAFIQVGKGTNLRIGTLEFQWPLEDGDRLWGRFVDRAGNAGEWQTHDCLVQGKIALELFVDAVSGVDTNTGSEASPVRTPFRARQLMEAQLATGATGRISYRRGQVHTYTSATRPWQGDAIGRKLRVIFTGYSIGADPIIRGDGGEYAAFAFGNLNSIELNGLRLEGQRTFGVRSLAVSCSRTDTAREPLNLLIRNCYITSYRTSVVLQDSTNNDVLRGTGSSDWVHIFNTEMQDGGSLHLFDSLCPRMVAITNSTMGTTNGEDNPNILRVANWLRAVIHNSFFAPGNNGSLRFQGGRQSSPTNLCNDMGFISISDTTMRGVTADQNGISIGRHSPDDAASKAVVHDIRLVRHRGEYSRFAILGSASSQNDYANIQLWDCTFGGSIALMSNDLPGINGQLLSFEARNCATLAATGAPAFKLEGRTGRFANGSVKIRNHIAVFAAGSPEFQKRHLTAQWMNEAETALAVDSDYCHISGIDAGTPLEWVEGGLFRTSGGADSWASTMTEWRAASTSDDNSTTRGGSNLGITALGTVGLGQSDMNARLTSGASVIDNLGQPSVHSVDADLFTRTATPNPGPFDFGATVTTSAPSLGIAHPVRVRNLTPSRFRGWHPINTDATVTDLYGITNGTQWVRGNTTGLDTRAVDILLDLPANTDLVLNNLVAGTVSAPAPVVPAPPFSGAPTIGGLAMTLVSTGTDGQATVYHYRRRVSGVLLDSSGQPQVPAASNPTAFVVDMWARWYPNEPWIRAEVMVNHSDQTSLALHVHWPDHLLAWGGGILTILGRAVAEGSIIQSGTRFSDGQARCLPLLWTFLGALRGPEDVESLQALSLWGITGHGIKVFHPDGPPNHYTWTAGQSGIPQGVASTNWGAVALPGSVQRLHSWVASPWGIRATVQDTGQQQDQIFVRSEPMIDIAATLPTYLEAVQWARKPCNYREPDGSWVTQTNHPTLRLWQGRPFNIGAPPGDLQSPDTLGKNASLMSTAIFQQEASISNTAWLGPNLEHWLTNGLAAACRYVVSPMLQAINSNWANVYLMQRQVDPRPPSQGGEFSFASLFSDRDIMWEPINVVHWHRTLTDRTLAAAVVARFLARLAPSGPQGAIHKWIFTDPITTFPGNADGSVWRVFVDSGGPNSALPNVPGYLPWQQGPACWSMDYALRIVGTAPLRATYQPKLLAAARRVLNDVWWFEGSPPRWVEYERMSLLGPSTSPTVRSRSGNNGFDHIFFPPTIPYLLRYEADLTPTEAAKANAIWLQMETESGPNPLGQGHDRSWFPPNELGGGEPISLVSITVSPNPGSQALGGTRQFTAIGTYSDASVLNLTESVNWTTSNAGVATVSNTSGSRGLATTVAVGSATITATEPSSSVTAGATFNVTAATLVSIAVTPASAEVEVDETQQFVATGTYSDSTTAIITGSVLWQVVNPIAVSVTPGGLATGLAAGSSTVTASIGAILGSALLSVTDGEPPIIVPTGPPTGSSLRRSGPPRGRSIDLGSVLHPPKNW
jgi:hypothetical protein